MMIEGGTLGFLGVWGVIYTWGSVVTRWILSVHIGAALSWCHFTCVETNGYGGGELGYDDRKGYGWAFGCRGSCIHLQKCSGAMDMECTRRRCTFLASLDSGRRSRRMGRRMGTEEVQSMSHMTFRFIYLRQMLRHDTTFQFNFFEANVEKNVATFIPMATYE